MASTTCNLNIRSTLTCTPSSDKCELKAIIDFNMKNDLYLCPNCISTNRLRKFVSINFNKIIRVKCTVTLK